MSFISGFISIFVPSVYNGLRENNLKRKENIMSNYNVGFRKSQSIFTRNAVTHKTLNNSINLMRGGIRL